MMTIGGLAIQILPVMTPTQLLRHFRYCGHVQETRKIRFGERGRPDVTPELAASPITSRPYQPGISSNSTSCHEAGPVARHSTDNYPTA